MSIASSVQYVAEIAKMDETRKKNSESSFSVPTKTSEMKDKPSEKQSDTRSEKQKLDQMKEKIISDVDDYSDDDYENDFEKTQDLKVELKP